MLLLLHKTLKGSRNIQGFALIRAVLFKYETKLSGSGYEFRCGHVSLTQNQPILFSSEL